MKILLLFLIVTYSSITVAGVGDTYLCTEDLRYAYSEKYNKDDFVQFKPQKFKFIRTEEKLLFRNSDGFYLNDESMRIEQSVGDILFNAYSNISNFHYEEGKFKYSATTFNLVVAVVGTCKIL